MKLSVVIPAHNEEGCVAQTISGLHDTLTAEGIEHELIVVNDNSTDRTAAILAGLKERIPCLWCIDNQPPNGYGFAVRKGLESFTGDAVAICMADASDPPEDLVRYYREMVARDVDCVFGSRFTAQSRVVDYPRFKMVVNRFANTFIQILFGLRYNDVTNAFKLYRRHVMLGLKPFLSHHFNLTVELPLKAIVRGYSYAVVPNSWINRKAGVSKLRLREMGSRYLFIVLYCLIEKWFSRGDYRVSEAEEGRKMLGKSPESPT